MMKRALFIVMGIILVVSSLTFSHAQEPTGTKGIMKDKQRMALCKQKMMGHGSCMGAMMKPMMSKSVLETKDGGLVVMVGNKLMKFDKDLNLVKEVEVKMDIKGMKEMMEQIMKNCLCPLRKKMMEKGSMMKHEGSGMKE